MNADSRRLHEVFNSPATASGRSPDSRIAEARTPAGVSQWMLETSAPARLNRWPVWIKAVDVRRRRNSIFLGCRGKSQPFQRWEDYSRHGGEVFSFRLKYAYNSLAKT
jgi:uncharacterized C2H2 Zn-finger protein